MGANPYPGIDITEVLDKLEAGYRMPRPESCLNELYAVMRECWASNPDDRPAFKQLRVRLETLFDSSSVSAAVSKAPADEGAARAQPGRIRKGGASHQRATAPAAAAQPRASQQGSLGSNAAPRS